MKSSSRKQNGFTLVEVLVVLAIIGVIASIIFPVFSRVREQGRATSCKSNLRQVGLAMQQYVDDNGRYPYWLTTSPPTPTSVSIDGPGWAYRILPYVKSLSLFRCPSSKAIYGIKEDVVEEDGLLQSRSVHYTDYSLNINLSGAEEAKIRNSANLVLLQEIRSPWVMNSSAQLDTPQPFGERGHYNRSSFLFADGHVKLMLPIDAVWPCPIGPTPEELFSFCLD